MTQAPPRFPTMLELLLSASASAAKAKEEAQRPPWPSNPFPPGIRAGSTTDRVLSELRRAFPQSLEHGQLRHRCQAARGAICWATSFLIHLGKIYAITDPRSPKYQRYRLASGEADDAMSCTTVCSPLSARCRLATLLCAVGVDRYEKGSITEPLRDYLLDYTQTLPSRVGIYFWPYPNGEHVIARDLAYADIPQDASFVIWLLKFPPVAFMVTWDEPDSHRFPVNSLTPWGDCQYEYEADIPINLEVPHSHWPEAPTASTFITGGLEAHMAQKF